MSLYEDEAIRLTHEAGAGHVRVDKNTFLEKMGVKAQASARNNNFRASYQVVRALSGFRPHPLKSVMLSDGSLSTSEQQR